MGLTFFFLSPSPHVMDNKTNDEQIILATGLLLHWVRGVRFSALPRRLCQQALSPEFISDLRPQELRNPHVVPSEQTLPGFTLLII